MIEIVDENLSQYRVESRFGIEEESKDGKIGDIKVYSKYKVTFVNYCKIT